MWYDKSRHQKSHVTHMLVLGNPDILFISIKPLQHSISPLSSAIIIAKFGSRLPVLLALYCDELYISCSLLHERREAGTDKYDDIDRLMLHTVQSYCTCASLVRSTKSIEESNLTLIVSEVLIVYHSLPTDETTPATVSSLSLSLQILVMITLWYGVGLLTRVLFSGVLEQIHS